MLLLLLRNTITRYGYCTARTLLLTLQLGACLYVQTNLTSLLMWFGKFYIVIIITIIIPSIYTLHLLLCTVRSCLKQNNDNACII